MLSNVITHYVMVLMHLVAVTDSRHIGEELNMG